MRTRLAPVAPEGYVRSPDRLPGPVLIAAVVGGVVAAHRSGAPMIEQVVGGIIVAILVGLGGVLFYQPRPRAFIFRQLPTFRRWLGTPDLTSLPPLHQNTAPASNLPSLDDLRRWQEFIEGYTLSANSALGRVNLLFEPTYAEMEPHLSEEVGKRLAGLTGFGLAFQAFGNPADEIKRLIYRDLEVVRRRAFKTDPNSDDDGYLQIPPRSS